MSRPYRSVLYIPGSRDRALEKAKTLPADGIIFDLEDAVAVAEKDRARALLAEVLRGDFGGRARIVRINGFDSDRGRRDAAAFAGHPGVDAILIPKVSRAADLDAVAELAPAKPLWAMMETALGMLHAAEIAAFGMFVFLDQKARTEEAWLSAEFLGYRTYAERVRRFIPGVY